MKDKFPEFFAIVRRYTTQEIIDSSDTVDFEDLKRKFQRIESIKKNNVRNLAKRILRQKIGLNENGGAKDSELYGL
jgi:hypothetical protein